MGGSDRFAADRAHSQVAGWLADSNAWCGDPPMAALATDGIRVSRGTELRCLRHQGLGCKNTPIASGNDRPKPARLRARWKARRHRLDRARRPGRRRSRGASCPSQSRGRESGTMRRRAGGCAGRGPVSRRCSRASVPPISASAEQGGLRSEGDAAHDAGDRRRPLPPDLAARPLEDRDLQGRSRGQRRRRQQRVPGPRVGGGRQAGPRQDGRTTGAPGPSDRGVARMTTRAGVRPSAGADSARADSEVASP